LTALAALLDRVASLGVTLHVDAGRLRFRAPRGAMTRELLSEIKEYESDLIEHLGRGATGRIPRLADGDRFELSHAQRRLWVLHELDPGTPAYHIPLVHELQGEVDIAALQSAFTSLVARHEALRTTIGAEGGIPYQQVHPSQGAVLTTVDLSGSPAPEAAARAEVHRLIVEPFDLACGPLMRAALVRIGPRHDVLAFVLHHIIADGVSIAVLMRELSDGYTAFCDGRSFHLPPLRVQYRDFAGWHNRRLQEPDAAAHRQYWLDRLAPPLTRLDIPGDYPRPPVALAAGAEESFLLDRDLAVALRQLCRQHGATLFMGLVAAVKALLHRYTGVDDVVVGTPVAARHDEELSSVLGVFINTLVLRDRIESTMTFAAILSAVRRTTLEALEHDVYPFDRLVQDVDTDRDPGRAPVFDVMVILQNQQTDRLTLPGLEVRPQVAHTQTSKFDLTFNFHEIAGEIWLGLEYRSSLFARERITRMGAHLAALIRGAARQPDRSIGALEILPAAERDQVVRDVNRTERTLPIDLTVVDAFEARARAHPDAPAVTSGGHTLSYGELDRRSNGIASSLQRQGAGPGAVVAVCLPRTTDLLAVLLGILKSGAAYTPLDASYPPERLRFQLRDSGARLLVTDRLLRDRLSFAEASVVLVESCLDAAAGVHPTRPRSHQPAYVIYTSGSTGVPKGVQVTHRNLTNLLWAMASTPGLTSADVFVAVTSLSFDIAGLELFLPLVAGARVVIATGGEVGDGRALQQLLEGSGATIMQGTPATWRMLLDAGWRGRHGLKVLCGGELLLETLADALLDRADQVWNMYGPTETTIWSMVQRVERSGGVRHPHAGVPIGRPIANTTVYIVDARGEPMPRGFPGQLCIGGAGVADGYWNRPELTADRFVPDPFAGAGRRLYRTGDLAVHLEDGSIQFLGRDDHQVKIRGFRVEIGEIEAALHRHASVHQAVVVAADDVAAGRMLIAYVVPRAGAAFDAAALRADLSGELPPQAVPSLVMRLDAIPLTPNGKVHRRALPPPIRTSDLAARGVVRPRDAWQRAICEIWASVLGLDEIGVHDNFFELGGHSLRATRATYLLQQSLGVDVALVDIFKAPTVAELAEWLRTRQGTRVSTIQPSLAPRPGDAVSSGTIAPITAEEAHLLGDI
jgi:amino acid adenylation domain-containing protein